MGIEKDLIRQILAFDTELYWQTMCLRNETDRPFMSPSEIRTAERSTVVDENEENAEVD